VRIGPRHAHEVELLRAEPLGELGRLAALVLGPQAVLRDEHSTILRVLRLTAVTKRFGARTVLNAVSLEVAAGEYVAVIGDSGIGKSTLLNVIAGLEPIDTGSVVFEGRELARLHDDELARLRRDCFGFVFQAFHVLPHLTVEENVALPLLIRGVAQREKPRQLIAAVGLAGREASPPRELSGGELQRVAIARALVGDPKLVLADEPTGNLDPDNARQVLALLHSQVRERGAAGIIATHSGAVAAGCDRRYRLTAAGLTRSD
jgi:putative ABC transport system ATP-binding protein